MKKTVPNSLILSFSIFFILVCFCTCDLQAQCRYKLVNMKNDTVSYTIPCDFPLMPKTGHPETDSAMFNNAFQGWIRSSATVKALNLPAINVSGISKGFFEIPPHAFATQPVARQNVIKADPVFYHIVP